MKLKVGDVIEVQGWVMLEKMEGRLKVAKVYNHPGVGPAYTFTKPRGRKRIVSHSAYSVDSWVNPAEHPNLNKIVKIDD